MVEVVVGESNFMHMNKLLAQATLDELGRRGLQMSAAAEVAAAGHSSSSSSSHVSLSGEGERKGDGGDTTRAVGGWLLDVPAIALRAYDMLPGRLERFETVEGVNVVLDGAHVSESVRAVREYLQQDCAGAGTGAGTGSNAGAGTGVGGGTSGDANGGQGGGDSPPEPVIVFGLGREKSASSMACALAPVEGQTIVCTQVSDTEMYASSATVAEAAKAAGFGNIEDVADPVEAVARAVVIAQEQGSWVLVIGSLHLCGSVRPWLRAQGARGGGE